MMHRTILAGLLAPLLLSAGNARAPVTVDAQLTNARAEAAKAAERLAELEAGVQKAGDEVARLQAEQLAAAAAIEAAEADISASSAELALTQAQVALAEQRLAERRAPLASLLAGLGTMGRQPPILAIADNGSVDEIVRVRALLDATMPVIQQRSAALSAELSQRRALAAAAGKAQAKLAENRQKLAAQQQKFAALEAHATTRAARLQGEAFDAGDRVLSSGESLDAATGDAAERRVGRATAAALASLEFAQGRPMRGDSALPPQQFAYSLPVDAPLVEGLGTVSRAGIASRGLRFATSRGASVVVPSDGKIAFAAPFRGQDGIVIIDHGGGWTSLLLGVASSRPRGTAVRRGEPLGRALGPIGVELRRDAAAVSPALIAASSVPLSNSGEKR